MNKRNWKDLKSFIQITRFVEHKGKTSKDVAYFISSLEPTNSAKEFSEGIRCHWSLESFHYIKDVTFYEDKWMVKSGNAPANYSLVRNIAINIFRHHGFNCIQEIIEKCANNIGFMRSLL